MGGGSRQSTGSGPGGLTEAPCQQEAEEAEEAASGRECLTHGGGERAQAAIPVHRSVEERIQSLDKGGILRRSCFSVRSPKREIKKVT